MNILAQCCGVLLLAVILYFHSSQKKIHLNTERAFMGIWGLTFASLVLDILSMVLITYSHVIPDIIVKIGCKAYVVSLVWVGMSCISYVCADIYEGRQLYQKYKEWFTLCAVVFSVVIFCLPLYICKKSPSETYTYGPAANVTYGLALSVLLVLGVLIHKHRNKINADRRKVMWVWMAVWLLGAVLEFISIEIFHSALLLVGYASAVGIIIIYLRLENPESNLDKKTGFFNRNALLLYIRQLLNSDEDFYLLCMSYSLGVGDNVPAEISEVISEEIFQFISNFSGTSVFRLTENEIVFLFLDKKEKERVYQELSERFEKPWGRDSMRMVNPRWYSMDDVRMVKRAEDCLNLFHYISQSSTEGRVSSENNDYISIDKSVMKELYKEREIENLLTQAMKRDWVEVYFQPIYSTSKQKFVSAEALVRIHDETGKAISPGVFIDIAEKTGLIVKLGEMVFEKVCRFIRDENPIQYGIEYIEVNLSLIQCGYEFLAEDFIRIMKKYEISPQYINLEITETASLDEKRMLQQNMQDLQEFGVSFSLDDFGTGHSNLNYIVDMPVDIVKFDRGMIQAYFSSDKAKYVMDAAMHMIQGMQLEIVSEGIETEEQYRTMDELGISFIQGYYFSKPLPEKEFLEFIQREAGEGSHQ